MTSEAPSPAPQPAHQHADDSADDLDVGPSFASMRLDEKSRRIIEWAQELDAARGVPAAPRKPAFDPTGYGGPEVLAMGPDVYTIPERRAQSTYDAIEYLPVLGVDGYIVKGWSHLLAGWWRLGKSELMAAVIPPWLRLGLKVLWITEEPSSVWLDRALMFDQIYDPIPWENLTLIDALSAPPLALLEKASELVEDVVIVDTIREACGIESMKDDDAIHRAMGPWLRTLRSDNITTIYIAQHRKAAGEHGERVLGSVTLPAKFDIVLELESVEGHERQRRLTARRRRRATGPLTFEMDDDDRIVVVPDGRSRGRVEVEDAVLTQVNASVEPSSSTRDSSRSRASRPPTAKRSRWSCSRTTSPSRPGAPTPSTARCSDGRARSSTPGIRCRPAR